MRRAAVSVPLSAAVVPYFASSVAPTAVGVTAVGGGGSISAISDFGLFGGEGAAMTFTIATGAAPEDIQILLSYSVPAPPP